MGQQLEFGLGAEEEAQRDQFRRDKQHLQDRLKDLAKELEQEPLQLKKIYEIRLARIVPIGMVYLWPHKR